ncbi:MAG: membrane protein insertion efficiency factor YidD [Elusimicrobium sp.]|jgi:putative membrane protein insertion efficiency factor|nr:membrane protein insertion efficiency factor YidD [Elusimicrobium sp.]
MKNISPAAKTAVFFLSAFKIFIRPLLGAAACRFYPSCTQYAREALLKYGFLKGSRLAAVRVCKCHPFHPGGYDPVP